MFKKVAVAIAFSPRCKAMLAEAHRVQRLFQAKLIIKHVGERNEEDEAYLNQLMEELEIDQESIKVIWKEGSPTKKILESCKKEKVDLLVAGALKQENLYQYYVGSVARKILRRSECSVLMITNPSENPNPAKRIVISGGHGRDVLRTIEVGAYIGKLQKSRQLHILQELKLYGLSLVMAGEGTEAEYSDARKQLVQQEIEEIERKLEHIDTIGLKINIKVIAGREGHEIVQFTKKFKGDLLIVEGPKHKLNLFDRMFPHDLEYIFADLPCSILVIKNK